MPAGGVAKDAERIRKRKTAAAAGRAAAAAAGRAAAAATGRAAAAAAGRAAAAAARTAAAAAEGETAAAGGAAAAAEGETAVAPWMLKREISKKSNLSNRKGRAAARTSKQKSQPRGRLSQ